MRRLRVLESMGAVAPAEWNALVGDASPFLEWEWLATLEDSGVVTPETGWLPQHLTLWEEERLVGACPLYVKGHSMGEFVFDQGWASAAARAGIHYYPKLLVAVPFTPVTGVRFLGAPDVTADLANALESVCREQGLSSAHVNFCLPEEVAVLESRGWLRRTGYQYHWRNEGLTTFEGYLASLRSKRRNQVRRERRDVVAAGVEISVHEGADVSETLCDGMYRLYRTTIDRLPWGQRYLNARFFALVRERFADRLCLILARQRGEVIAGTFNVQKGDTFYGRYWGATRDVRYLHFDVCYYAAIEHCVARGLRRFEPGAGGEFKHLRGFEATATESVHLVTEPRLAAAVREYLELERQHVAREIDWLGGQTALRRDRRRQES